jgi:glycosyltransferase involved in cell wall biosynthesis
VSLAGVRVALVTRCYLPTAGDLARTAGEQAQALAAAGAEVIVLTHGVPSLEHPVPPSAPGCVCVYRLSSPYEAQAMMALEQAVRPIDVMHTITLGGATASLHAFPRDERPLVVSLRERDGAELDTFAAPVLQRASWIVAASSDVLRRARRFCDIDARSSVIPPATDVTRHHEWRATPDNQGVVGAVIDMEKPDTVRWLIDVYRRLPAGVRRRLMLSEEPKESAAESEDVLQLRCACGLSPDMAIHRDADDGHRVAWLPGIRVFVMASVHDGALRALHEATAAGVPIVAATVDGVQDLLTDRVDALLVPPGDQAKMADAIRELLTNDALAKELSTSARRAAPRLTAAGERDRYVQLYERVLDHARTRYATAEPSRA